MADLSISIITDYLPSQINNIDILIAKRSDIQQSQFRIMTDFPDQLNLRDGVVLTKFRNLDQGEDYNFTVRVFLNQEPFVVNKSVLAFIRNAENEASVVFPA